MCCSSNCHREHVPYFFSSAQSVSVFRRYRLRLQFLNRKSASLLIMNCKYRILEFSLLIDKVIFSYFISCISSTCWLDKLSALKICGVLLSDIVLVLNLLLSLCFIFSVKPAKLLGSSSKSCFSCGFLNFFYCFALTGVHHFLSLLSNSGA